MRKIFLFTFVILLILLTVFNRKILSKTKPIQANILVVEGWLPECNIEQIVNIVKSEHYDSVFIIGYRQPNKITQPNFKVLKTKNLWLGGKDIYLNKKTILWISGQDSITDIRIYTGCLPQTGIMPHYAFFFNDSLIGQTFLEKNDTDSSHFKLKMPAKSVKTGYLFFDNDCSFGNINRNLRLDSIQINQKVFYSRDFDYVSNAKFKESGFGSEAAWAANYLNQLGITNTIVVDTLYIGHNKTNTYAKKFYNWTQHKFSNKKPLKFNFVSSDYHSRRSFHTYKKLFGRKNVGIISLPHITYGDKPVSFPKIKFLIDEYLSLIGNYFYY